MLKLHAKAKDRRHRVMSLSISTSLFLHLALAVVLLPRQLPLTGHKQTTLSVELQLNTHKLSKLSALRQKAVETQRTDTDINNGIDHRLAIHHDGKLLALPIKEANETIKTPHTNNTSHEVNKAMAKIESKLHTELARHFHYPYLARQRGWQGKVLLGFNVETDGSLAQIRVARSSGYAVLDHSALDSLSKVKTLADAGMLPRSRITDMQIPVIYRLED